MKASGVGSRGSGGKGRRPRTPKERALVALKIAAALGVVYFAVEGGEYGTSDLLRQRRAEGRLRAEIDSVQRIVDSLDRYHQRLRTDPELQERIAREEFGMVKGEKELIYRFADSADSAQGR